MSAQRKKPAQADRIVAALTAEDSELRSRGVSSLLEFVLDLPLSVFVDPAAISEVVTAAATGPNATIQIDRHWRPGWDRHVARCAENGDTLGAAVPEELRPRFARLILETPLPKDPWAKDAVDPKLVRELLAPVLQEFLMGFARRLPIPGAGGGESEAGGSRTGFGLRNRLKQGVERRAERFVEAGKSVLGGLSAEVERQIQGAAREFSESAGRDIEKALFKRLRSPEGRRLLDQMVTQAVDHVLDTPISRMNAELDELPWDDIWALVPPIVEHNRGRDVLVAALEEEIAAVLAVDGERSLREMLDEAGTLDTVVGAILDRSDAPARELFASDGFRGWLDSLLAV